MTGRSRRALARCRCYGRRQRRHLMDRRDMAFGERRHLAASVLIASDRIGMEEPARRGAFTAGARDVEVPALCLLMKGTR
jgi:hypothetical protein